MQVYNLKKISKLEDQTNYGIKYWAESDKGNLMFYSRKDIAEGMAISANNSENRTSTKGTMYEFLKGVAIVSGEQTTIEDSPAPSNAPVSPVQPPRSDFKYQPKDEAAIKAMWAIGQSIEFVVPSGIENRDDGLKHVEEVASELYAMVERVKVTGVLGGEKVDSGN